jgi:CCR4-NOT transcription complex subunit 4
MGVIDCSQLIPTLRSTEYFGQYGKISKILLVKRTSPGGGGPVVGLYVTYHRKEDAGRCIAAVDGVQSPGGGRDIMRASHGTTKYCLAFLRGVPCNDHSCMNLHEWGDEKDYFTKEDLATLCVICSLHVGVTYHLIGRRKHTIKATETRSRTSRKLDEDGEPSVK